MLHRILFAALAAGLLAGALISAIQSVTTTPIILHAEEFESAGDGAHAANVPPGAGLQPAVLGRAPAGPPRLGAIAADADNSAWAPRAGLERALFTTLANLLVGVGFALLVVAGMALHGKPVTIVAGVLWGAAGFAVFTLAPALGLPPEVPGSITADLQARQLWWAGAVLGTVLGLGLIVFTKSYLWKISGLVFVAIPHIIGAPRPETIGGPVPPELAAHFAAATIVVGAIFWLLIGGLSATFYRRFG